MNSMAIQVIVSKAKANLSNYCFLSGSLNFSNIYLNIYFESSNSCAPGADIVTSRGGNTIGLPSGNNSHSFEMSEVKALSLGILGTEVMQWNLRASLCLSLTQY
jgi:hypothetical protein